MTGTNLVGFDSAWADRPGAAGALCAVRLEEGIATACHPPRVVSFDEAHAYIAAVHRPGDLTLVAIDQPTIVPNQGGMRPVERCVSSIISWSGGGMQPAYRGKTTMFGDAAPIWRFLARLDAALDPFAALTGAPAMVVMEVYPALALLALEPDFTADARHGPRYNPSRRKTFLAMAWARVCQTASRHCAALGLAEAAAWCGALEAEERPSKAAQDRLDSILCLVVAASWLKRPEDCAVIGDGETGLIVSPMSDAVWSRLATKARTLDVPMRSGLQPPNVSSKA